ncbi:hypothetical protein FZC66_07200 [Priestia megaterium]|nr:hypothetical protein FZC66_07200 [Priestia megaterium]
MITKREVIQLLLEACPSFQPNEETDTNNKEGLQQELSRFASHLISLEFNNQLERERDVFEVIERLYIEGESEVKEAVTTGLFETIQHMLADQHIKQEEIGKLLKPHSFNWWKTVEKFSGSIT